MATDPIRHELPLDIREQLAPIDQVQADLGDKLAMTVKTEQDIRFAPSTIVITALGAGLGAGAGASSFAAGGARAKLVLG